MPNDNMLTDGERNAIERAISEVELCCQFSLANELRALLAAHPGQPEPAASPGVIAAALAVIEADRSQTLTNEHVDALDIAIKIQRGMFKLSEPRAEVTDAARDVLGERRRQVTAEGWTPERDDKYTKRELAYAASNYAVSELKHGDPPITWPWDKRWWKPTTPRRNLVKAGALILAEIERLDRAAARAGEAS